MAQKVVDFKVQPAPAQSTTTSIFTLASFDVASIPGGVGNITDCTIYVRSRVLKFEVGGGTYTQAWEHVAVFRRESASNPTGPINATVNGNAATGGLVGSAGSDTVAFDVSGTTIRQRITPQAGTHWWWCKLEVMIVQGA